HDSLSSGHSTHANISLCLLILSLMLHLSFLFFFFNDPATTEIYTLSLHDALPILLRRDLQVDLIQVDDEAEQVEMQRPERQVEKDRKSTRLNSSHSQISYAVFCLKKKKKKKKHKNLNIKIYKRIPIYT